MSESFDIRVGTGVDAHAYETEPGSPLRLAGLEWPDERALSGHSDGDVVCHALVDALLSAANLGDIGQLVGIDRAETADASSTGFVKLAVEKLATNGWRPVNASIQLIGEHPRFAPRRIEAEAAMSALLTAPVSVGATTSDGMGFTGRGEGIFAIATVLIHRTA